MIWIAYVSNLNSGVCFMDVNTSENKAIDTKNNIPTKLFLKF